MPGKSNDPVDVLIIGAGASGAAVAWSLAGTRMRIVCMEQGDWTNPSDYPTNFPDWEQRLTGPDHIDPQRPRTANRLPDQQRRVADLGGQLQRRGWEHHPLRRALPAAASVGLPGEDTRRRGGRLAGQLRPPRAALRGERPHDGRLRTGRRSVVSAEAAAPASSAARGAPARPSRVASTGSAGTGGRRTAPSSRGRTRAGTSARTWGPARPDVPRARNRAPTSPIGPWRCAAASSCGPAAGCVRSP